MNVPVGSFQLKSAHVLSIHPFFDPATICHAVKIDQILRHPLCVWTEIQHF